MKRRDFLSTGTLATAGLATLATVSCNTTSTPLADKDKVAAVPPFELD